MRSKTALSAIEEFRLGLCHAGSKGGLDCASAHSTALSLTAGVASVRRAGTLCAGRSTPAAHGRKFDRARALAFARPRRADRALAGLECAGGAQRIQLAA